MENSVKQRIKTYLKAKRFSGKYFCEAIGVSSGYISGMRKSIQPDKLNSIAIKFPDLNIEWLLTGEGEMLRPASSLASPEQGCRPEGGVSSDESIPVIPVEIYKETDVNVIDYICRNHSMIPKKPKIPVFPKYDMFYEVYDSSMSPDFRPGDMLALKALRGSWTIINGEPYILNTFSCGLVFRLVYDDGDILRCKSFNEDRYTEFNIPKDDIANLFRIVGLFRLNV